MKIKSVFRYLLYVLVALLLAAALLPYVFKDRILAELKAMASEFAEVEVDFTDADLSFIRSFPLMQISIDSLTVDGVGPFEGIGLLHAEKLRFDTDLSILWDRGKTPEIKYLGLVRPNIHILIDSAGRANYDVFGDEEGDDYYLRLQAYDVVDGRLRYTDHTMQLDLLMEAVNHEGSGDFTRDVFDLDTRTRVGKLNAEYEGITYLRNIPAEMNAKINVDFPNEKYTLKDNTLTLNKLAATGAGFVQFDDTDMILDFEFSSPSTQFGDLVSSIAFLPMDPGMKADGRFTLDGRINGRYNDVKGILPAIRFNLTVSDGKIAYPDLPYPIDAIRGEVHIQADRPDWKDLSVNIPGFSLGINREIIGGALLIDRAVTSPHVKGHIKGKINLENWKQALPLEGVEKLKGLLDADVAFAGSVDAIERQDYEALEFKGRMRADQFEYQTSGSPVVGLQSGTAEFSPARLNFSTSGLRLGSSSLKLNGYLLDPLAMFAETVDVSGEIEAEADVLDLNEWTTDSPADSGESNGLTEGQPSTQMTANIGLKARANEIKYGEYSIRHGVLDGRFGMDGMQIRDLRFLMGASDLQIKGEVSNLLAWMEDTGTLFGKFDVYAHQFNADEWMGTENQPEANSENIPAFRVPANMDVRVQCRADRVIYSGIDLKDCSGSLSLRDESLAIEDFEARAMDGKIGFTGLYDSKSAKPQFDSKIDLSNIHFGKAYDQLLSMQMLAPIAKYIEGFFNTTLVFSGSMNDGMLPDFTTLDASGYIETINSSIKNADAISQIAQKLNVDKLKSLDLEDTRNWFVVENGRVEFKEKAMKLGGIPSLVRGSHRIGGDMDYQLDLKIPRVLLQQNKVTAAADRGLSFLEKEAGRLGLNISQGENIDVRFALKGRLAKPSVKMTLLGASESGSGFESIVKNVTETIKDTVRTEINKKKEQALDSLSRAANKEADKLKNKAEEKAEEVINKTKEEIKTKAAERLDSTLVNTGVDSLSKKAKDAVEKTTGKSVDDIKDKLKGWDPFKKKKKGN